MDKFINAFSRSQYKKDEEGRSYQFAKRLSTTTTTSIASPYSAASTKNSIPGPTLNSSYLSVIELDIYNKWWEGLDPFGLGVAHEEAVHPFLESSGLETNILQQIFDLYSGEVRYTEEQFFAILRLIAHIQNGRKMNRDLVALGAPLPQFSHDSVDPLIPQTNTNQPTNNATNVKYTKTNSNSNNNRNSWWGQTLQQSNPNYNHTSPSNNNSIIPTNMTSPSQDSLTCNKSNHPHRHSYADSTLSKSTFVSPAIQTPNINSTNMNNSGPSPVHNHHHNNILASSTTDISPHFNKNNNNNASLNNNINNLEWAEQALSNAAPLLPSTSTSLLNSQQNKLNTSSPKITTNKGIYTHSRSRSVPFAAPSTSINDFIFDTVTSTQTKHDQQQHQQQRPPLMPSRSSIDSASFHRLMQQQEQQTLDYGQSLLLTQKFVPLASTIKSTNPFEDDDNDDDEEDDEEKEKVKEVKKKEKDNDHYHHHQEGNMNNNNNNNNTYNNGIHINQQQSLQPDQMQPLHQQFLKSPFEDSDNEENSDSENEHHEFLHHATTITSTTSKASTPITSNNINHNNNMSLLDSDNLDFNILSINNKPNSQHALPPPVPAQSTKPPFPRNSRHQTLKRSQSQYNGHTHSHPHQQHPFMTQGEFLLATSTSSHSIEFPVDPFPSLSTSSNTNSNSIHKDNFHSNSTTNNQLFRHRSTSSVSRR